MFFYQVGPRPKLTVFKLIAIGRCFIEIPSELTMKISWSNVGVLTDNCDLHKQLGLLLLGLQQGDCNGKTIILSLYSLSFIN